MPHGSQGTRTSSAFSTMRKPCLAFRRSSTTNAEHKVVGWRFSHKQRDDTGRPGVLRPNRNALSKTLTNRKPRVQEIPSSLVKRRRFNLSPFAGFDSCPAERACARSNILYSWTGARPRPCYYALRPRVAMVHDRRYHNIYSHYCFFVVPTRRCDSVPARNTPKAQPARQCENTLHHTLVWNQAS